MRVVNTSEFDQVIEKGIVLVDFYADWCGPCKMLSPIIEQLANENNELEVIKVNVDNDPDLARRYKINSIPHLLLFKDGKLVNQTLGYQPLEKLKQFISIAQ